MSSKWTGIEGEAKYYKIVRDRENRNRVIRNCFCGFLFFCLIIFAIDFFFVSQLWASAIVATKIQNHWV